MDSPILQSHRSRMRTNSNLSVQPVDSRGAIQKRTFPSRQRSISTTQVDRLHQLAVQQSNETEINSLPSNSFGLQWLTPQHSPQPHVFSEPAIESFSQWTVPTPPRSDSGLPTLSVDSNEVAVTSSLSSGDFGAFEQPTSSAAMRYVLTIIPSLLA